MRTIKRQVNAASNCYYVLLQMKNADADVPQEKLDAAKVGDIPLRLYPCQTS